MIIVNSKGEADMDDVLVNLRQIYWYNDDEWGPKEKVLDQVEDAIRLLRSLDCEEWKVGPYLSGEEILLRLTLPMDSPYGGGDEFDFRFDTDTGAVEITYPGLFGCKRITPEDVPDVIKTVLRGEVWEGGEKIWFRS